jgi:NAD(P)-dependent dehydrogenase (short-subunit alcohol dehydrogenase family)
MMPLEIGVGRALPDMVSLTGRVALVTGGGGHLGQALALALAEAGALVALTDRDGARMEAVAALIETATGQKPKMYVSELVDESAVRALPSQVARDLGGLDILVNNAAFVGTSDLEGWAEPFERQGSAAWRAALEVNLTSVFELTQSALPMLRDRGVGSVINIASIYGLLGPDWSLYAGTAMANPAAYAASKGGLIQLTRWLATTLGPELRVNAISPGGVARGQPKSFSEKYEARTPLRRMAREDDFKGAVVFLASDMSSYITGQNIVVDGGWSVW